eukprot:TRINITY_DN5725_c0_g1_i1.p1 TRINITY_DN5725_c0_g1~~TRINITY_DN5725_c0_g1_i1.p1  ORF type:complete len:327 (+),score=68.98 TRINITY_DN5725_c0_g1_i1:307-1287(+)
MNPPTIYTIPVTILDMIFVGTNGYVVALDKRTGQRIWKTFLKHEAQVSIFPDGQRLLCGNNGYLFSLSVTDGSVVWKNGLKGSGFGNIALASSDIPVVSYTPATPIFMSTTTTTTTPSLPPPTTTVPTPFPPPAPTTTGALLYPDPSDTVPSVSSQNIVYPPPSTQSDKIPSVSGPSQVFSPNPQPFAPNSGAPLHPFPIQMIPQPQPIPQPVIQKTRKPSEAPLLVHLHNVVFLAMQHYVHAINKTDGSIIWRVDVGSKGDLCMIVENEMVFVGSAGFVYALSAANGKVLWKNDLPGCGYSSVLLCTANQRTHSSGTPFPSQKKP